MAWSRSARAWARASMPAPLAFRCHAASRRRFSSRETIVFNCRSSSGVTWNISTNRWLVTQYNPAVRSPGCAISYCARRYNVLRSLSRQSRFHTNSGLSSRASARASWNICCDVVTPLPSMNSKAQNSVTSRSPSSTLPPRRRCRVRRSCNRAHARLRAENRGGPSRPPRSRRNSRCPAFFSARVVRSASSSRRVHGSTASASRSKS